MSQAATGILALIITLVICGMFFVIFREFVMWYWKINEVNKNLLAMVEEQKKTNQFLGTMAAEEFRKASAGR